MDGAEEALVTQAHKADGEVLPGEGDDGAVGHGLPSRVHAEIELLLLGMGDEAQDGAVRHNDGAQGEVVDPDGGDDQAAAVGREDGTSAAEGIGCGARGRGHNEAVAGIGGHEVVADIEVGAQQGGVDEAVEVHFVECKGGVAVVGMVGSDIEEGAGLEGVAAGHEVGDEAVDIVAPGGGEEAEVPEVDAKDRDVAPSQEMYGAEEGAVASDGEEEVERAVGQPVVDDTGLHPPLVEEGDKPVELGGVEVLRVFRRTSRRLACGDSTMANLGGRFGGGVAEIECYVHECVNVLSC